ncbi:MAG: LacI family DNA-binding transcriptional regulator [Acidimicrobiales bacterium]
MGPRHEQRRRARREQGPSVKLADVAARAGVSTATASRVLNDSSYVVSDELRARVLAAASELHYTPNAHAQAVARGASDTVGLVVHDIADPYFSTIAAGVTAEAEDHGMVVLLANTRRDPELELQYVAMLSAQRARAVIIAGSRSTRRGDSERLRAEIERFRGRGGQVACISQNRLGTDTIRPQNASGARALARELARLGHRRFAVLAGPPNLHTARDRTSGFRTGLLDEGVGAAAVDVRSGAFTRDGGYEVAEKLVADGLDVSCVFAVNDVMAVGAMAAFRDAGLEVPEDVSVAGFDDIATLRDLAPPLTTVHLPLEEMGRQAARLALDARPSRRARVVDVRGEVILRQSTRAVD